MTLRKRKIVNKIITIKNVELCIIRQVKIRLKASSANNKRSSPRSLMLRTQEQLILLIRFCSIKSGVIVMLMMLMIIKKPKISYLKFTTRNTQNYKIRCFIFMKFIPLIIILHINYSWIIN